MHIILLGTAAGGGFPQWNCWMPTSRSARETPALAHPRTQSSVAISADGTHWFLLNASPDVREQLHSIPVPPPATGRQVPFEGIVLTDAEVDHSLGVTLLREARRLPLYATASVFAILADDSGILRVTEAFAEVPKTTLAAGVETPLLLRDGRPSGITVEPFLVPADPPSFARHAGPDHTVGLLLRANGRMVAYAPGCGGLDATLVERLSGADLLLFDGTFWQDDEMIVAGLSKKTARDMDHLPISGADGSLVRLAALPIPTKVYVHINTTNPILLEQGAERRAVEAVGLVVGDDGMRFTLAARPATS
jgi:pyrroloquinoline quinone biosynthesis protein B